MNEQSGVYEELLRKQKEYPSNQHTYPLFPSTYNQALTQQLFKDISSKMIELINAGEHGQVLTLMNELNKTIDQSQPEYSMPLKAIHYRNDDDLLPKYPELFLSHPQLLTNHEHEQYNLFKALKFELQTADQANFMVSFVRWSGLQLLIRSIDEFTQRGENKRLRVITSTYLKVTEPKALRRLAELPNVETKVFDSGAVSFHTKAYLFSRSSDFNTAIIGSSNLSFTALQKGHEWNVKLPSGTHFGIYEKASDTFEQYWNDPRALPLTEDIISRYEKDYKDKKIMLVSPYIAAHHPDVIFEPQDTLENETIMPNGMQQNALAALENTRDNGHDKGVVIAATGTGKTYLSAFDVKQFGARTMLFLAHRDEILESSKRTFAKVFGGQDNDKSQFGKLTGYEKDFDSAYVFSTVQTLSRDDVLTRFSEDHFDYIIIDEFHHAEAATYKKVIDHFKPKFLLGLTATPERMDGQDVLAICDHNVVYEIRLRDALKEGLLTPFRYYGLSDPTVDYDEVQTQSNGQFVETELVRQLNTHERVDYVTAMIEKFGFHGTLLKGLGFCASIEHAVYMSEEFNRRGYTTACLTGADSPEVRQEIIKRLESDKDPLQLVFTINIFNEGVDIPKLNLILFLRPTESATIFIQQLGRGLRKVPGKEYVTVLDFIGNYSKSFIVPLALSGQHNHKAFDRDSLRVAIETEFSDLPEGCFVDLEEISKQQILKKIELVRLDRDLVLKDLYNQFKKELGHAPEIRDFLYFDGAPNIHFFITKYGSWAETKKKMNDMNEFDEELVSHTGHLSILQRLERMLPVKWPYELSILSVAVKKGTVSITDVVEEMQYRFAISIDEETHLNKIEKAMNKLATPLSKHKWSFGNVVDNRFTLSSEVSEYIQKDSHLEYFKERLEYGLNEFRRIYRPQQFFSSSKNVVLYQNYTRNDLIYLFESEAQEGTWREGVSKVGNHILFFINLNKGEAVEEHLLYHDYFVDQKHFHWQSQNATKHESPRGQEYIDHKNKDIHIHLFIRKFGAMHGVTLPFTYLGEVDYVSSHGDKPMNITWQLHHAVPDSLFTDFIR